MFHVAAEALREARGLRLPSGRLHAVRLRAPATACGLRAGDLEDFEHIVWSSARTFGSLCSACAGYFISESSERADAFLAPGSRQPSAGQADLIAVVAHALLQPLVAVHTGAQMLRTRCDELPRHAVDEMLRLIVDSAVLASDMVMDLVRGAEP